MTKISILGSGLIGSAIANDFSNDSETLIEVVDINKKSLKRINSAKNIKKLELDVSSENTLSRTIADSDLVVNALPGFMGFNILKNIIKSGKNIVDISFAPEDAMELDMLAKENGATVIIDAGVAPGMSNMLVARGYELLDKVETALIYVGGLPIVREWPYEYKAGFSPIDVLEEYTRPVFHVINGQLVKKEALSEVEKIEIDGIGTLEAFNTDGLRTLSKTMDIPNMSEKTLRYPGHAEKMEILKISNFFSTKPININGNSIKPIDISSKLLFPMWELKANEADMTVMKIIVSGEKENKKAEYQCFLHDMYDPISKVHSMAKTTGYTATMIARLILDKKIKHPGIIPPETIGKDKIMMDFIFEGLNERKVYYKEKIIF